MFLGTGSAPVAAGWCVLPGVELPSSGQREAEHRRAQHQRFQVACSLVWKSIFALLIYTSVFPRVRKSSTTADQLPVVRLALLDGKLDIKTLELYYLPKSTDKCTQHCA